VGGPPPLPPLGTVFGVLTKNRGFSITAHRVPPLFEKVSFLTFFNHSIFGGGRGRGNF